MRIALLFPFCLLLLPALAQAEPAASGPYQPMAFLAGSCWKGDLPVQGGGGPKQTDEHCFSWVYGDKFLRDMHTVHTDDGRPDYVGETLYYWDPDSKRLRYLYIENQGGHSQGTVRSEGGVLMFPEADEVEDGRTQPYRSHWQRSGADAYDAVTEFKKKDGSWVTAWAVHMQRSHGA